MGLAQSKSMLVAALRGFAKCGLLWRKENRRWRRQRNGESKMLLNLIINFLVLKTENKGQETQIELLDILMLEIDKKCWNYHQLSKSDRNQNNILHKACLHGSVECLSSIIRQLTKEEVCLLLRTKNKWNHTPLDYLLKKKPCAHSSVKEEKLVVIFDQLFFELLLQCSVNSGQTWIQHASVQEYIKLMHKLCSQMDQNELLRCIHSTDRLRFSELLDSICKSSECHYEVIRIFEMTISRLNAQDVCRQLLLRDGQCDTVFHKIIASSHIDLAYSILKAIPDEFKLQLLCSRNINGHTPLMYLSLHQRTDQNVERYHSAADTIRGILSLVNNKYTMYKIINTKDDNCDNILHHAISRHQIDLMNTILDMLDASESYQILTDQERYCAKNALMDAVSSVEILDEVLGSIHRDEDRIRALQLQALKGDTALHIAVDCGLNSVKVILQSLDNVDDKMFLLRIQNDKGQSVVDHAKSFPDIARYLEDIRRERVELVSVDDTSHKDGKGKSSGSSRDQFSHNGNNDESWSRYSPAVDRILFQDYVAVGRINQQEVYSIYNVGIDELKCKSKDESMRILSYGDGFKSHHMAASALARAGFISCKKGDEVACIWCEVKFGNFKRTIDPVALHWAYSEKVCEFIMFYSQINIPLGLANRGFLELADGALGGGLQPLDSGFISLTQNPSMVGAAQVLTLTSADTGSGGGQDEGVDIQTRFINCENRTDSLAMPTSEPLTSARPLGQGSLVVPENPMRYEVNRLMSFYKNHWNKTIAERLALAGFYLIRDTDDIFTLACPFCDNKINGVAKDTVPMFTKEKEHTPLQVHTLKFPSCAFIQGTKLGSKGNVPILSGAFRWEASRVITSAQITVGSELENVGIATVHAKYPAMAVLERRSESFLPMSYDHPKGAEELSAAGYFYNGDGDAVICFWCGVMSGSWSVAEDAWIRHARSSRSCQFVLNEKGADFVSLAIEEHGLYSENRRDEDRIRNVTTRMIRPRMDSRVVQAVIGMGYSRDHVKTAIINRLKKLKPDYTQTEELVADVLELKYKDMSYHRELLLPDVLNSPISALPDAEDENDDEPMILAPLPEIPSPDPEPIPADPDPEMPKSVQDMTDNEKCDLSKLMMSQLTCKICISSAVGIIFLPCAHLVCCTSCAAAMTQCPICRQDIAGTIKANV